MTATSRKACSNDDEFETSCDLTTGANLSKFLKRRSVALAAQRPLSFDGAVIGKFTALATPENGKVPLVTRHRFWPWKA